MKVADLSVVIRITDEIKKLQNQIKELENKIEELEQRVKGENNNGESII